MEKPYSAGNWIVRPGCEEQFIERWRDFLAWTRSTFSELESAALIRDADESGHFVSFAGWNTAEAMADWRSRPQFAAKLGSCRELCDDFRGASYSLAAKV